MDSIKRRIVESSKTSFLQHDYNDVCLTEICRDAGITTGAFYRRFSGKKELIQVIVDLAMSGLKAGIKEYQAKMNEQFPKGPLEQNWLSALVYQYQDELQIMLRHTPIMEKDTYLEEVVETLMDACRVEKNSFAHIAFKAYFMALVETTLYYESSQDAESCIDKIRTLIGLETCKEMAI